MRTPFIFGIVFCASLSGGTPAPAFSPKRNPRKWPFGRRHTLTRRQITSATVRRQRLEGPCNIPENILQPPPTGRSSRWEPGSRSTGWTRLSSLMTTAVHWSGQKPSTFQPSKSAMNDWGVKHVDIKILEYGDFEKSREILEQRTKYSHVRKMLAGINKNPGPKTQKKPPFPTHKPFIPAPPKVDLAPVMQLASAPPAPKPVAKSPTLSTPPAVAPPPMPAPLPKPEPTPPPPLVASAPAPLKAAAVPAPTPRPTIPAPAASGRCNRSNSRAFPEQARRHRLNPLQLKHPSRPNLPPPLPAINCASASFVRCSPA